MKVLLLSLVLGNPLVVPVADNVPTFDVRESCQGAASASKAEGLVDAQTLQSCLNDENQARAELVPIWTTFAPPLRDRCEGEATLGGLPSYVDLLVCLQIGKSADPGGSNVTPTQLKGASKKKKS